MVIKREIREVHIHITIAIWVPPATLLSPLKIATINPLQLMNDKVGKTFSGSTYKAKYMHHSASAFTTEIAAMINNR